MITVDISSGVTCLTLNRADKANALTADMLGELKRAVEGATTPVLMITGRGKVFSAGADLDAVKSGLATSPLWEELSGAIGAYPGLTIAVLNGTAAGGSLGMVLACDLRVSVPGARIFYPVMRMGVLPQPSDLPRLRALAPGLVRRVFLAGEKLAVEDAPGLIDQIGPDPMALARGMVEQALAADPAHVAALKQMVSG